MGREQGGIRRKQGGYRPIQDPVLYRAVAALFAVSVATSRFWPLYVERPPYSYHLIQAPVRTNCMYRIVVRDESSRHIVMSELSFVVVLTLHSSLQCVVRGRRKGPNNSGAKDYPRRKNKIKAKDNTVTQYATDVKNLIIKHLRLRFWGKIKV